LKRSYRNFKTNYVLKIVVRNFKTDFVLKRSYRNFKTIFTLKAVSSFPWKLLFYVVLLAPLFLLNKKSDRLG